MTTEYRVQAVSKNGLLLSDSICDEQTFRLVYAKHVDGQPHGPAGTMYRAWAREVTDWVEWRP